MFFKSTKNRHRLPNCFRRGSVGTLRDSLRVFRNKRKRNFSSPPGGSAALSLLEPSKRSYFIHHPASQTKNITSYNYSFRPPPSAAFSTSLPPLCLTGLMQTTRYDTANSTNFYGTNFTNFVEYCRWSF